MILDSLEYIDFWEDVKKKKIVASDYFQYIATLILNANIPQLLLIHIIKITGKEQFIYLTTLQISLH